MAVLHHHGLYLTLLFFSCVVFLKKNNTAPAVSMYPALQAMQILLL